MANHQSQNCNEEESQTMLHKHTQKSAIYTRRSKGQEKADGSRFLYLEWNGAAGDVRFFLSAKIRQIHKQEEKKNWSEARDVEQTMRQPWKKTD